MGSALTSASQLPVLPAGLGGLLRGVLASCGGVGGRTGALGVRQAWAQIPALHLLAVLPWVNRLTSLSLYNGDGNIKMVKGIK